jgi:hypothetical protein
MVNTKSGLYHPVHGAMGEGALHREDEVTVKQRNLVMGPIRVPASRRSGRQTAGRNVT